MDNIGPEEPPQQPKETIPPVTPVMPQANDQVIQTPPPAYTPPHQPPKKKGVSAVLLTIVLVVAAIFIAAYAGIYISLNQQLDRITHAGKPVPTVPQITKTPSAAETWKTLTKSDDGFSVQYPTALQPVTITPENQPGVHEVFWSPADQSYSFGILTYPINTNPGVEFIAEKTTEEKVTVAGQLVTKKTGIEAVSNKGTLIHVGPVVSGQKSYLLFFSSGSHVAKSKDIASFNKVVNSFNLSESTPSIIPTKPLGNSNQEPKICTQEAKLCSDGSYVSRTGPNCEFAACPR